MGRKGQLAFNEHWKSSSVYFRFLKLYYMNPREVGSVVPDSKTCVDALLKFVPFHSAEVILEYGAASGAVTREIIKRKNRETILICFEKNINFHNPLAKSIHGQNVIFINDDVFNCAKHLPAEFGVNHKGVDCIISTLPCSSLNVDELLPKAVLPLFKRDGFFIQYMHILSFLKAFRLNPLLRKYFSQISSDFVLFNIPPALIYTCRILREMHETADNTAQEARA